MTEILSASNTLSVPKYLTQQWTWGSCNHWSSWFSTIHNGVFLQASLSAPINSQGSLFSQGTFPPFRFLEELAKTEWPHHRDRTWSEGNLPHSGQPPFSPGKTGRQPACQKARFFWPGNCFCRSLEIYEDVHIWCNNGAVQGGSNPPTAI